MLQFLLLELMTGVPTRAAFDCFFSVVKRNVKKVRY